MPEPSKEIDEVIPSLEEQLNSAKFLVAEIKNLHENLQVIRDETTAAKTQTDPLLQSVQGLLASATESANQIDAIKKRIEQAQDAEIKPLVDAIIAAHTQVASLIPAVQAQADNAATKKSEIDGHLAAMREALAGMQQQLESAKSVAAEFTTLHANAQTTSNQTVEVKAQAAATFQSLQTLLTTATENANRIEAVKTEADQTQGVIATKSSHIEGARLHADEAPHSLDRLVTKSQQSAINAEAQHQSSRAALDNLNSLYTSAQTVKATTDSDAAIVAKLRQQCEEHTATAKKLADIAEATDKKINTYEARLAELEVTAADRLKIIEALLPGATSAGLASAFNQRRGDFRLPQYIWQSVFVISVLGLLAIATFELHLFANPDAALSWDHLGLSLLFRLPVALPLIWLAFHASHKAALAQRVEQNYAFKETVLRSFEGYRREMAELEGKAAPDSPLSRLCAGVLSVITNPPGRIYEKHRLNRTPLNAIADSAGPIGDGAAKITTATLKVEKPA